MPNPLYEKSGRWLVLTIPLIIFMDDILGNVSKQWNKHHVIYMSNATMLCEMLEKEFCIHFVSLSPHVPPLELMWGFQDSLQYGASSAMTTDFTDT